MKKFIQDMIEMGADFSTKKALKRSLRLIGLKPENVDRLYIEFKNDHYREAFKAIEPKNKMLFLPQCLRTTKCRAQVTEMGYQCVSCSKDCKVCAIKAEAEKRGYRVFISPGGSMNFKVIRKFKPKAVIGVACLKELVLAAEELRIPLQGVELSKNGCVATDVELQHVLSML